MLLIFAASMAPADVITIGFVERPGYCSDADGRAEGLLVDIARDILTRARVEHRFQAIPQIRLLNRVKDNAEQICALGLFKNSERETFAVFSKVIYQNQPIGVLIAKEHAAAFAPYKTIAELLAAKALTLGYIDRFSYGAYLDGLIAKMNGSKVAVVNAPANMVGMLAAGRFDYMFADPEEYVALANSINVPSEKLKLLSFPDIQEGNKRYLMCSRSIPEVRYPRQSRGLDLLAPQRGNKLASPKGDITSPA